MGLADIVTRARGKSGEERRKVPRRARLMMALYEVNRDIKLYVFGSRPRGSTSTCESCSGIGVDEEALIESFNDDPPSGGP
jgi:hypothetical protein